MDYSNTLKKSLEDVNDLNFNDRALEIFRFQAKNNSVYNQYISYRKINPEKIDSIEEIPFLPIEFFKNQKITTGDWQEQTVFFSSGTTGTERSNHYIRDLSFYENISAQIFESFFGPLKQCAFIAFLPSYLENKSSSLIHMVNHFMEVSSDSNSCFVKKPEDISAKISKAKSSGKKVVLWGVTHALLDLAELYPQDLSSVLVMETGGMKGKRKEVTREELHEFLKSKLNISTVYSEYGMTELLSQAYSTQNGLYTCSKLMKILIRELYDPFSVKTTGKNGGINIIDLANVDSCSFIETKDIGTLYENNQFSVLGRMDNSDIRGCNLLHNSL